VHVDGLVHRLEPGTEWTLGGQRLDDWLIDRGEPGTQQREPLLSYGSNGCPSKIGWLRAELGLTGPVVVLRARCTGLAAVWAAGFRVVDDQRAATLAAAPGSVEDHVVWLATPEQLRVLDRCEGRGERYRLVRLHSGRVELEDGTRVDDPLAYVGLSPARHPLLVDGAPVRCADLRQAEAMTLQGTAADTDRLVFSEVDGPT
jgi:hypothetical protein